MKIEKKNISELIIDPFNARSHSEENLRAIKFSLRKFGQQKPIVIDRSGVVIAGNGTLEAAISLGWKQIDCVSSKLTGSKRKAFAISDNRTSELAEWDKDVLGKQLQELREENWQLDELGFNTKDFFSKYEESDEFENDCENEEVSGREEKFLLEIEFLNRAEAKVYYEKLLRKGLIVRFKNG